MKSKNKPFMYLCLLVALFCIQPSYAGQNPEEVVTNKEQSDIKSGDEITITEVEPAQTTKDPPPIEVEEKKPQSPAKVDSKKIEENKNEVENKERPNQTIDPRATEVNERVNKKYREEQEAKKKQTQEKQTQSKPKINTIKKPQSNTQVKSEDVEALIDELNASTNAIKKEMDNLKSNNTSKSKEVDDYEKAVDRVSDTIKSDKISQEESRKIAKTTKKIVAEYNKKIEAAKTTEEKEALVKEASQKINQNLLKTSEQAFDRENSDEESIYDQKNETLVLEIEADEKDAGDDEIDIKGNKMSSLEKSQKPSSENQYEDFFKVAVAIFIILLASLSATLYHLLKKQGKKSTKS